MWSTPHQFSHHANRNKILLILKASVNPQYLDRRIIKLIYSLASQLIGISFKYEIFLENDDLDEDINEEKFNRIKEIII